MSEPKSDPVTFDDPPVNEVILSVQLAAPVVDEVDVLANYWPSIRASFPGYQKQPPLPPLSEDFSPPWDQIAGPTPRVEFMAGPMPVRYWFTSEDETRMVQVQADRFTYNWRQIPGREAYPRYRELRPEFEARYTAFLGALPPGPAEAAPEWCEVTYINHIAAGEDGTGGHVPLSRILRAFDRDAAFPSLPPVEDTQFQQRFRILGEDGVTPVGRFYVAAVPAFRAADTAPIYVVTLVARGRLEGGSVEAVLGFFDRGRALIVNGFKELTTDEMHDRWGLHRAS